MRCIARITAVADGRGGTRLEALDSQPPLTARRTIDGVTLVGSAGGPLGGDEVDLAVRVGRGACLRVGSAGAMVVLAGRDGRPTRLRVGIEVGDGGRLVWHPSPTVVTAGACLEATVVVRLAPYARLDLTEHLVLGRYGEPGGQVRLRQDAVRGGVPLLRQEHRWGVGAEATGGAAVLAGGRVVISRLLVGPEPIPAPVPRHGPRGEGGRADSRFAVMALAEGALLATAVGQASVATAAAVRDAMAPLACCQWVESPAPC